jgi:hypothetical protein
MEAAPEKSITQKAERLERAASGAISVSELPNANELLRIPRLAGNMAMQRLLRDGALRAKLTVGAPNDIHEQEADRVADTVLSPSPAAVAQRKCGCGGSASNSGEVCASCADAQKIQAKPNGSNQQNTPTTGILGGNGFGRGRPLDSEIRSFMETRFNRDFCDVRVHTDTQAAATAASINARAFTLNNDVVFAEGQYKPSSDHVKRLIAHELTHVVQQGQALQHAVIQRQTTAATAGADSAPPTPPAQATPPAPPAQPASTSTTALIVEDSTDNPEPHQMKRSQFLSQVRGAVNSAAEQALSTSPWAAMVRPQVSQQIESAFSASGGMNASTLEQSIRQQVPGAAGITTASAFIPLIAEQARQRVVEALPKEDAGTGALNAVTTAASDLAQGARTKLSDLGLSFKGKEGGVRDAGAQSHVVKAALGQGQPLDSSLRSQMESAFDHDFSHVQVHTGVKAGALSTGFNARAFTIGNDIAFGAGEYRPGTLIGDAIMAHELAHVVQQRGSHSARGIQPTTTPSQHALEEDADNSAIGAVISMWTGTKNILSSISQNVMPVMRSGLRLQRCDLTKSPTMAELQREAGQRIKTGMGSVNTSGKSLDSGVWYWLEYHNECMKDPATTHKWDETKYKTGYTSAPQFTKTSAFRWEVNQGASASAAIQAWLKGLTVAECASTAVAVYYDAIRAHIGDDKFDEYFKADGKKKLVIAQSSSGIPLEDFLVDTDKNSGFKEGDWYYWKNHPMYEYKHPAGLWQGESAIYMGEKNGAGMWSGFGAEPQTYSMMLKQMLDAYNEERTSFDNQRLTEIKEQVKDKFNGALPPAYRYPEEGGTLIKNLGEDPEVIVREGGGPRPQGVRLNVVKMEAVKRG